MVEVTSYESARRAKAVAQEFLRGVAEVIGCGIAILDRQAGDYGVKVNLSVPTTMALPNVICGGVPLITEVVGTITAATECPHGGDPGKCTA